MSAGVAIIAAGAEVLVAARRMKRRNEVFKRAQARARATGKPLMVIGDPDTGLVTRMGRAYGCGDVCFDLTGCPGCPEGVAGRLEDTLPRVRGSWVVYVSCVLEYVDDFELVWGELMRISDGDLFVVTVDPWSLTAFVYPGAKRRFVRSTPQSRA